MQDASTATRCAKLASLQSATSTDDRKPKLLDQLREALRSRHYCRRTEQAYCHWVERFIPFHEVRHPAEMAERQVNAFLAPSAIKEKVSVWTQNQALPALLFLYRHVRPSTGNIPTPRRCGAGNGFSLKRTIGKLPKPAKRKGIIWTNRWSRKPCKPQSQSTLMSLTEGHQVYTDFIQSPRYSYRLLFKRKLVNRPGQAEKVVECIDPSSELAKTMDKKFWVRRRLNARSTVPKTS